MLVCPVKYVCENVVRYNYYLAKEYHTDQLLFQLLQLAFVSQTVVESGYHDIKNSIPYKSNIITQPFLVVEMVGVKINQQHCSSM